MVVVVSAVLVVVAVVVRGGGLGGAARRPVPPHDASSNVAGQGAGDGAPGVSATAARVRNIVTIMSGDQRSRPSIA